MSLFAFLLHLIIDTLLGVGILNYFFNNRTNGEKFAFALLLGMLIETTLCFWLMWLGLSHKIGFVIVIITSLFLNLKTFKNYKTYLEKFKNSFTKLKASLQTFLWYEWIFIVLIAEKFLMTIWQLVRMPVYHSDASKHWAAQAHAIYASINFSMDSTVPEFMARYLGAVPDYPLQLPIWAANNAFLAGGWSDFAARSYGLLLLVALAGIIYTAFVKFTQKRWLALGVTLLILSLPLQIWHAASGYGDLGVEVFLAGALLAFLRKEWIISGLLLAGAGWSKNDGIAVFFPAFAAMFFMYQLLENKYPIKEKLQNAGQFLLGFAVILPWLIFQGRNYQTPFGKIFSPIIQLFNSPAPTITESGAEAPANGTETAESVAETTKESLPLFYDFVITGSTHGIFWMVFLLGLLLLSWHLVKDKLGQVLLIFTFLSLATIYYIFTFTPAYEYLVIQTTIHRTMLQFSAAALLVLGYGLSLYLENVSTTVKKAATKKSVKKKKKR